MVRQHGGTLKALADVGGLKTRHLFSFSTRATRFAVNDSALTRRCSFPQALQQPSTVHLSAVCCRIRGTGDAADELDDFDNVKDAGGGRMAERWMNGLQNLATKPLMDARRPSVDTVYLWMRWQTSDDGEL